jgi:hypothetical protein
MIEAILLAFLKIVELAMEGQTPEQRAKMWDWYIEDMENFRKWLKELKIGGLLDPPSNQ